MKPTSLPRAFGATLLALSAAACAGDAGGNEADPNIYTVSTRNLPITIKENAELQALRETVVRSEVEGQATIIYLAEEGRIVDKGEKLVELDASDLVDKQRNQGMTVANNKASFEQAQKSMEILQKELTTKLNTAKSNLIIAQMELEKFLGRRKLAEKPMAQGQGVNRDMVDKLKKLVSPEPAAASGGSGSGGSGSGGSAKPDADTDPEGEMVVTQVDPTAYQGLVTKVVDLLSAVPHVNIDTGAIETVSAMDNDMGDMANQVLQQIDQIRLAMADLKVKEDTLGYSLRLAKKQFITRNELDKDRLAWQSQVSKVTLAWNDLDLLVNYELLKTKIKLMQDVDNAKLELERVQASNDAETSKAKSDLESKGEQYTLAKDRLDNLDKQIKNAVIYAPTPGLVIYARLERGGRSSETIREGTQVRERQDLIILPDTTKMQAVVKVQEAVVAQVRLGQRAHISVEAWPDKVFTGRVTRVAQQADSSGGWMSSDRKVYTTVVEIDGDNSEGDLRSRMAAAVTIMVDELHDVLAVPLQAVRRDRSANFVWQLAANGPQAVPVEVGRHNAEHVVIAKGLTAGDRIFLAPPAGAQQPNLPQPEVPMPEVNAAPETPPAAGQPGPGKPGPASGDGGAIAGGSSNGDGSGNDDGNGPGARGNRRGGNGGPGRGARKKFVDMTPEELEQYKSTGLAMYPRMLDMMRQNGQDEAVKTIETDLPLLQKALDDNKLEEAQVLADKLRSSMRPPGGMNGQRGDRRGGGDRQGQPDAGDGSPSRGGSGN